MAIRQAELQALHMLTQGTNKSYGREIYAYAGGTITTGQICYMSGQRTNHMEAKAAKADALATCKGKLWVAMHGASTGDLIRLSDFCLIQNVDTSTSAIGAPVWLSTVTAGATALAVAATGVLSVRTIGEVINVSATVGTLLIDTTGTGREYQRPPRWTGGLASPLELIFYITTGTTGSPYDIALPAIGAMRISDAFVICNANDAGGTAQLQTGAGVAISDAIACATADAVVRAASIASAQQAVAAGATLRCVYAGGGAAGRGELHVMLKPNG